MKKGISLIVLVITIIVIIILAGAVILSLAQNNPIGQANEATRTHDAGEIESALSMYIGTIMGQYKDQVKLSATPMPAVLGTNVVNVVNMQGVKLWRSKVEPTVVEASATNPGTPETYEELTIDPQKLGLATWPNYPGYNLEVDQYANVEYKKIP